MADGGDANITGPAGGLPPVVPVLAQRLAWVPLAAASINRACGKIAGITIDEDTTDKLRVVVHLALSEPLEEGSARHVRRYIQLWANINDCVAKEVRVEARRVSSTILVKYRGGGESAHAIWDPRPVPVTRASSAKRTTSRRRGKR